MRVRTMAKTEKPAQIPKSVTNRILKSSGLNSKAPAKDLFNTNLEALGKCIAGKAATMAKHANRKQINKDDVSMGFNPQLGSKCFEGLK